MQVLLFASVAQGIEHRSPKAGVVRSNRISGTPEGPEIPFRARIVRRALNPPECRISVLIHMPPATHNRLHQNANSVGLFFLRRTDGNRDLYSLIVFVKEINIRKYKEISFAEEASGTEAASARAATTLLRGYGRRRAGRTPQTTKEGSSWAGFGH